MDKKSIAILLVASSFASSAFANSIINQVVTKHSAATSSIIKTHKMTKKTNHTYTDFSGTWMVDCGEGTLMSTVIENDADYISLDSDEFRIGQGLQGKYESNEDNVGYEHASFEWNEDGSALIMKGVDVSKENVKSSAVQTDMATFTLTMRNGQINLDGKWIHIVDVANMGEAKTIHCVLTKKQ